MSIGENIRNIRKAKKMSQNELGKLLGVSQAMIAQYENGIRTPKLGTIARIAEALNVFIGELDEDWGTDIFNNPADYEKTRRKLSEVEVEADRKIKQEEKKLLDAYWRLSKNNRKEITKNIQQLNKTTTLVIDADIDVNHPFNILQEKLKRGEQLTTEETEQYRQYMNDALNSLLKSVKNFGERISICYEQLNESGQKKADEQIIHAIEQVELLAKIPEYQKDQVALLSGIEAVSKKMELPDDDCIIEIEAKINDTKEE